MLPTLDALEARRTAFTATLDALPLDAVHQAPSSGAWSLAQIAHHLVRVEQTLRLAGRPASPVGRVTEGVRLGVMNGMLALPIRYPMPPGAASRIAPAADAEWPVVRETWATLRSGWRAALPDLPPRTVIFKHPIIGLLSVAAALRFIEAHHRHHDAQIARTLAVVAPDARISA